MRGAWVPAALVLTALSVFIRASRLPPGSGAAGQCTVLPAWHNHGVHEGQERALLPCVTPKTTTDWAPPERGTSSPQSHPHKRTGLQQGHCHHACLWSRLDWRPLHTRSRTASRGVALLGGDGHVPRLGGEDAAGMFQKLSHQDPAICVGLAVCCQGRPLFGDHLRGLRPCALLAFPGVRLPGRRGPLPTGTGSCDRVRPGN